MLTKQDVAFRHYREFNADGTVNPRGGVTVAFPKDRTVGDYGAAYCSKSDNFTYEFGRNLALERLNKGIEANGPSEAILPPEERFVLLDMFVTTHAAPGYHHITRSKYRRKSNG